MGIEIAGWHSDLPHGMGIPGLTGQIRNPLYSAPSSSSSTLRSSSRA